MRSALDASKSRSRRRRVRSPAPFEVRTSRAIETAREQSLRRNSEPSAEGSMQVMRPWPTASAGSVPITQSVR